MADDSEESTDLSGDSDERPTETTPESGDSEDRLPDEPSEGDPSVADANESDERVVASERTDADADDAEEEAGDETDDAGATDEVGDTADDEKTDHDGETDDEEPESTDGAELAQAIHEAHHPDSVEEDPEDDDTVDGSTPVVEDPDVDENGNGAVADVPATENGSTLESETVDSGFGGGLLDGGPEGDEEMPLTAHIEEMLRRLAVVFAVGGAVMLILYPGADLANAFFDLNLTSASDVINYLWNTHIPGAPEIPDRRPRLYGPLELLVTELKVAGLVGFVVGLPVFVYQTFRFMRPGLYPRERRYYLSAVPTSLVLALVGVSFAHFIVLPAIFAYFTSYTVGTAIVAFGLKETFNLILVLMGYMALVFQIPLFIMLGTMMDLFSREWLESKRLLFWGGFLGVAFLISPDPTGMAPIIVGVTMISLFEGTLALMRWTGH